MRAGGAGREHTFLERMRGCSWMVLLQLYEYLIAMSAHATIFILVVHVYWQFLISPNPGLCWVESRPEIAQNPTRKQARWPQRKTTLPTVKRTHDPGHMQGYYPHASKPAAPTTCRPIPIDSSRHAMQVYARQSPLRRPFTAVEQPALHTGRREINAKHDI